MGLCLRIQSLVIGLLVLVLVGAASAQPPAARVEIAAQASLLRLDPGSTNAGVGGRMSFDLTEWIALEGEFSYFPADTISTGTTAVQGFGLAYHRRRAQALFGIKAGRRTERVGVFAKIRPGFTRLSDRGVECLGDVCALMLPPPGFLIARPEYRTEFALDFGGVLEFYPTARTVARFELGDTVIRHRSSAPPCIGESCTTHNIATGLGLGFRF